MKKAGGFFFLLIFFLLSIPNAWAVTDIQLVPAHPNNKNSNSFTYLFFEGKTADEKQTEFAAVNLTDQKVILKFETFDAVVNDFGQITGNSGVSQKDVGNWIKIPDKETVLLPRERKNIPVSVKIPVDASPGQHIGVITSQGSTLPVWINVDGEVKSTISLQNFSQDIKNGQPVFSVKIKNSGNTVINSLGFKIVLTNYWSIGSSRQLESFWGEESVLLPGQEKEFHFSWENVLPFFGSYNADLEVASGEDKETADLAFSFIHWSMIGGFLIRFLIFIIMAIIFVSGVRKLKKRISLKFFRKQDEIKIQTNNNMDNARFEDQIKKITLEERSTAILKEEDYDKLFFKVRKIVREEIELWKEMETFRKEVKEQLKKEFLKKKSDNKI